MTDESQLIQIIHYEYSLQLVTSPILHTFLVISVYLKFRLWTGGVRSPWKYWLNRNLKIQFRKSFSLSLALYLLLQCFTFERVSSTNVKLEFCHDSASFFGQTSIFTLRCKYNLNSLNFVYYSNRSSSCVGIAELTLILKIGQKTTASFWRNYFKPWKTIFDYLAVLRSILLLSLFYSLNL